MPFYPIDASFAIGQVKESMMWRFLKPFQFPIWWTIFGTLVALFMTYLIINWAVDAKNASGYLMSCLKLAIRQGVSSYAYQNLPTKILMVSVLFASFVIVTSYSANLVAISAVVKEKKIDTFLKLSENPNYKVMFHKGSAYQDIFLSSNNPIIASIRKNQITGLERHQLPYENINYDDVADQVYTENLAFVTGYDEALQTASRSCMVTAAKERWREFIKGFAFKKFFRYEEQFNLIISRLLVTGFIDRWTINYQKDFFKPSDVCENKHEFVSLAEVGVHFAWMGFGVSVATIVFILEIFAHKWNTARKSLEFDVKSRSKSSIW